MASSQAVAALSARCQALLLVQPYAEPRLEIASLSLGLILNSLFFRSLMDEGQSAACINLVCF